MWDSPWRRGLELVRPVPYSFSMGSSRTQTLIIALTLACSACGRDNRFSVDFERTTEEKIAFQAAADQWCEASDGEFCVTFDGGDNHVRLVEYKGDGDVAQRSRNWKGDAFLDLADLRGTTVWAQYLTKIIRHELGHQFAYDESKEHHLPAPNVMTSVYTEQGDDITESDLTEVRSVDANR